MSLTIQPDIVTQQELQSRGVDSSVGVFGSHHVQIGKGNPIRLDVIKSAAVTGEGWKEVTKVTRGKAGIRQTANDALAALATPGSLDVGKLLGLLKAQQTYLERLDKLNRLDPAQKQDADGLWMFTKEVEGLSNEKLAAIFQKFNSPEMDLLQTALMREGQVNPQAKDARMAASRLFNVQALILKEIGNRAALSNLSDLRAADRGDESLKDEKLALPQKLSNEYGGIGDDVAVNHQNDITAANLAVLAEVSSSSANEREKIAVEENAKLQARGLGDVKMKELGDVLRSAELTINISIEILAGDTSIVTDPDKPLANIWHLKDMGLKPKGEGYLDKRDSVEQVLFPEFAKHDVIANERPVYGALNIQHGYKGGAQIYGNATIVLKPEVAKRATYTLMDTFLSTRMKVDAERRANVFKLLDGTKGIPGELKDALKDPASTERKDLEKWFDRLQAKGPIMIGDGLDARAIPHSIQTILNRHDTTGFGDGEKNFLGLLYNCFGDKESMRKAMATHDNIESLLPHLGDVTGNALANAALKHRNGNTPNLALNGPEYIEAHVQGPLIPSRDIAEIRVDLTSDGNGNFYTDEQKADYKAKMKTFEQRTHVKVVFVDDLYDGGSLLKGELDEEQGQFNLQHLDMGQYNAEKDKILADPLKAAEKYYAEKTRDEPLAIPEGTKATLTGAQLSEAVENFKKAAANIELKGLASSGEDIVRSAFEDTLGQALVNKGKLLETLGSLHLDSKRQLKAFAEWICETPKIKSSEELKFIHKYATARAALFREIAAAEPPLSSQAVLDRFVALAKDAQAECALLASDGLGGSPKIYVSPAIEMERISKVSLMLLKNAEPPVDAAMFAKILERIDSPDIRVATGQLDAIADWGAKDKIQGGDGVMALVTLLRADRRNIAALAGDQTKQPRCFAGALALVQEPVRNILRSVSAEFHAAFEARFPSYPKFPAPAWPEKLPKNAADRRRFLLGVLEPYRRKELVPPERCRSVHGRGHIVRSYIFANAMCNILKEQGVNVDKNAVVCGISGHDLGRAGLGDDIWEKESAEATVNAMKTMHGADSMGADYENELAGCINKQQVDGPNGKKMTISGSKTLEGQLLNAADCLDIGRTQQFDKSYFDFLRGPNGELTEDAEKLRDELIKEADLLQRLTNPLCANRQKINQLQQQASDAVIKNNDQLAEELQTTKNEIIAQVGEAFVLEAESISNEDYIAKFENTVKNNPQLFPLLNQYAFAE